MKIFAMNRIKNKKQNVISVEIEGLKYIDGLPDESSKER